MKREFQRINIPKLPVLSTEDGIKRIKEYFGKLIDWRKLNDFLPNDFSRGKNQRRSGIAGLFSGSLELTKEGNLSIKQNKLFDDIYIKEK
jgi:segregation and condensation protein A